MADIEKNDGPKSEPTNYEVLQPTRTLIERLKEDANFSTVMSDLESVLRHPQNPLYLLPASESRDTQLLDMRDSIESDLLDFHDANMSFADLSTLSSVKRNLIAEVAQKILEDIRVYEEKAQNSARQILDILIADKTYEQYRAQLADALGLGKNQSGFLVILKNMSDELPEPVPKDARNWPQDDLDDLRKTYEDMKRDQHILLDSVFNLSIINFRMKKLYPKAFAEWDFGEKEKQASLRTIGSYLGRRLVYRNKLGLKRQDDESSALALMAVASELGEEYLEEKFDLGTPERIKKADAWVKNKIAIGANYAKSRAVVRGPKLLARMRPDLRAAILEGYSGAQAMLGASAPTLNKVAEIIYRSPMGQPFWRRILAMNNPVTGVLMLIYVNRSDDKLKASMLFSTYMAGAAGMGAVMETWGSAAHQKRLWRGAYRRWALRSKMARFPGHARLARLMRMGPKNPMMQFAIIMGVAIWGGEYVEEFVSWIDDDVFDDSPEKEGIKEGVNVLTGGTIIEGASFIAGETIAPMLGITDSVIDPERDALSYLGSTQLLMRFGKHPGSFKWRTTLEREKTNNFADWNRMVDLAARDHWNPVKSKLMLLEKAGPGSWADRQAFQYFGLVEHAKQLEDAIATEMVKRKKIVNPRSLCLLMWATNDQSKNPNGQTVNQIEDTDNNTIVIRSFIKGLEKSKSESDRKLHSLWRDYRIFIDEIARRATVYRHLGVYKRSEWLGENQNSLGMTDKVHRGVAEEIKYLAERDKVLLANAKGKTARGEFSRHLSSLTLTELKKTDVSDVIFSSIFTPDGKIVDMRSHYYKRALIAAVESAALGLPEHYDINALFEEMRHGIANNNEVSIKDVVRIRDKFTDAIREHSLKTHAYTPATKSLSTKIPSVSASRLFVSRSIDDKATTDFKAHGIPDNWPDIMLQKSFEKKLASEKAKKQADIVLFQQVIPEWGKASKYKLAVQTMTCIECPGQDPLTWVVHIHRHQTARDIRGFRNDIETSGDNGNSSSVPYLVWIHQNPTQALQIRSATEELSAFWSKTPVGERMRKVESAEKQASISTDEFVEIPYRGEYRRIYGDAVIVSRGSGGPPWFPDDPIEDRRPLEDGDDFVFVVSRTGKEDETITISDRDIGKINKMPKDKQAMVIDVLTTPFENASPKDEVARVLNVFYRTKSSPSNFGYHILGNKVEFHYVTLHNALIPLYKKAKNKKYFLERLYSELDWRKDTINEESVVHLTQWFESNMDLFTKATTQDIRWFETGDRILGWPNKFGVYSINKSKVPNTSPIEYKFYIGSGWWWRPNPTSSRNPHPKKWYKPHQTKIPWKSSSGGKTRLTSPKPENVKLIEKLQPYSKK